MTDDRDRHEELERTRVALSTLALSADTLAQAMRDLGRAAAEFQDRVAFDALVVAQDPQTGAPLTARTLEEVLALQLRGVTEAYAVPRMFLEPRVMLVDPPEFLLEDAALMCRFRPFDQIPIVPPGSGHLIGLGDDPPAIVRIPRRTKKALMKAWCRLTLGPRERQRVTAWYRRRWAATRCSS